MARRLGRRTSNPKDRGHDDVRCRSPIRYNPSVAVPAARPIRDSGLQIKLDEGKINDCLHLWIGYGVANHVVSAGPQSGFRLVLLALQTSRNLFRAACSCDLLYVWAADSERSSLRPRRLYGGASHAAFRVAGNGYESGEREVRYRGEPIYARGYT